MKMVVLQGTILSPLLFILNVNEDLDKDIQGTIISYAEDTGNILHEKQWGKLELVADETLNNCAEWLREQGVPLNMDNNRKKLNKPDRSCTDSRKTC